MVIPKSWEHAAKYQWLEAQAHGAWDSLASIGAVWMDKETWRLVFSQVSLKMAPLVNSILFAAQEATDRTQVLMDTIAPWFLSWGAWDAGLLGLLTAALSVLIWDFL